MLNRYPGKCAECAAPVASYAGHVETTGYGRRRRSRVLCAACFNASDHSSHEDRECGDRAYEDACARACGMDY